MIINSNLQCPECHVAIDDQYVLELFSRMQEQSILQNEPQLPNYVDVFKCNDVCPKCLQVVTWLIKWTKIGQYLKVEQLNPKDLKII